MSKKVSGEIHVKLCLLGDGRVGKTSLRRTYLGQGFLTQYLETLGADFALHSTNYNDLTFKFQIWDLAGQPRFDQLRKSFYIGSQAAIILYDITNQNSLNSIKKWISELMKYRNGKGQNVPLTIIGNKIDLRETYDDPISTQTGKKLVEKIGQDLGFNIPFLETSAKTGENVEKAFQLIIRSFVEMHKLSI